MLTEQYLHTLAHSPADLTAEHLLFIFQEIGDRGDVIIYKHDGERAGQRFTVLISIIGQAHHCRRDGDSLSKCVQDCLRQYLAIKNQARAD